MNCAYCNAELEPGAKVCGNCGSPVEPSPAQATLLIHDPSAPQELPAEPGPAALPDEPALPGTAEEPAAPSQPAAQAFSLPPEPAAYVPVGSSAPAEEKVLGMEAKTAGVVALGLGIAGIVFSCVGCGGLLSLLGIIAGFMSLKTSGRQTGQIGMILSIIGLVVTLIFLCLYAFAYSYFGITSSTSY